MSELRDNKWLEQKLHRLIEMHFPDVDQPNPIEVKFGRKTRTRFGSIRLMNNKVSRILINGHFKDAEIPEEIILATLAHEFAHYTHGFSSLRPRLYRHPHKYGVVSKELEKRGLGELEKFEKRWSRKNWRNYLLKKMITDPSSMNRLRKARSKRRYTRRRTRKIVSPLPRLIAAFLRKYLQP